MVWFADDDERLAPEADLLVLMRNRQYLPRLGRFLQPDPNATGVAVQPSLAYGGSALPTPDPYVDLNAWAADGTSALAYALSDPVNGADPSGLSLLGMLGSATARFVEYAAPSFGDVVQNIGQELFSEYSMRLSYDVAWATEWEAGDDWHTRLDNTWVQDAFRRGTRNAFEVGIPFTDYSFNPADVFASDRAVAGMVPGSRVPGWLRRAWRGLGKIHHVATAYGDIALRFQVLFKNANMQMNDVANLIPLRSHVGPHDLKAYHEVVYSRLNDAVRQRPDWPPELALRTELLRIRLEIQNGKLKLNRK